MRPDGNSDLVEYGARPFRRPGRRREKTFVVGHGSTGSGSWSALGRVGEITVQKAVSDAKQILGEMVGGINPVARKRDATAGGMTLREAWELTSRR